MRSSKLLLLVLTLFLAACASTCGRYADTAWIKQVPRTGNWPAAAQHAQDKACQVRDTNKANALFLQAVSDVLDGRKPFAAKPALKALDGRKLSGDQAAERAMLHARLSLMEKKPGAAVKALGAVKLPKDDSLRRRFLRLQVRAARAAGDRSSEIAARVHLAPLLKGKAQKREWQIIWKNLSRLSYDQIVQAAPGFPALQGWYALAYMVKSDAGAPYQLRYDLRLWHSTYPDHPANRIILPQLRQKLPQPRQSPGVPARVALLLPLTGSLAPAGQAVAAGVRLSGSGIAARAYDTAGTPQGARAAYRRALAHGADWLIGPLSQDGVMAVAQMRSPRVTELVLNNAQPFLQAGNALYQLSLGPDAEVRALAERALTRGKNRAAMFYPDTQWGRDTANAFAAIYGKLGGRVVASGTYPYHARHLGGAVRHFLHSGGHLLWRKGRHNNTTDMLFLVADPRDGRLIHPLMSFYYAGGWPTYAPSRIFSGQINRRKDRDLDGITFCAMPFLMPGAKTNSYLRSAARKTQPGLLRQSPDLLALGADAALIAGHLQQLRNGFLTSLNSYTGRLQLAPDDRILRRLPCARFRNGVPSLLPGLEHVR